MAFFIIIILVTLIVIYMNRQQGEQINYEVNDNNVLEVMSNMKGKIKSLDNLTKYEYETEEISVKNGDKNIYGVLYRPKTESTNVPLVIYSHGLGGTHIYGTDYAQNLATYGIATYCFDFCGGSSSSRSDEETTDMSILTEVSDLEAVINTMKNWKFVDNEKIVLLGTSQGGAVSAITAARHKEEIAGAILCYSALQIPEDLHELFPSKEEIPDTYYLYWINVGRKYMEDVWDYNIYKEISNYDKKVLLLHGDKDSIVDISVSEKASKVYKNAEFYTIQGAGHGFSGNHFEETLTYIFDYLQEINIL